ncbi:hypothetical protein diail_10516 [Diaporthe ilicicola]|nr:hypothetical protein diail_10516 [Diaporthe ilicicola]
MADSEDGWEQFRSDLRVSRMAICQKKSKLPFEIPIRSQAPKYNRGSGPPPPRIGLQLVHDSNAFIVDKVVFPYKLDPPQDGLQQRRCYYIIGWPDLPLARPAVDATKILDYVSPRTLEDWEYQDALRREEEREKAREEEEHAEVRDRAAVTPAAGAGRKPGPKRTPGRPRSAMMVDEPTPDPELNSEQEEILQRRRKGPSLSTPQKSRLARLVAEEDMLKELEEADEDPESAIHRQLESDSLDEGVLGGDVNNDLSEDPDLLQPSSAMPGRSSGESSQAGSARPAPTNPASSLSRAAGEMATYGASISTLKRPVTRDHNYQSSSASPSRSSQLPVRPPISTTPIPLPHYMSQAMKQRPSLPNSLAKTVPALSTNQSIPRGHGQGSASTLTTSQSYPQKGRERSHSTNRSPSHDNSFTPTGGAFPRPPKRPAEESAVSADAPAKTWSKKGKKKKRAELSQAQPEPPAEAASPIEPTLDLVQGGQDYVVKRLEGDYVLDGVHWFKVRWEGEWPEDQNPTWEPKENIAGKLVKEYLKRKAKREASKPASKSSRTTKPKLKRTSLLADWARGYSNVAEAFEGQAELDASSDPVLDPGNGQEANEDADTGPDELLVVDKESETAMRERRNTMNAEIAEQFASMARGAPRQS